jgi:hypothetical protein
VKTSKNISSFQFRNMEGGATLSHVQNGALYSSHEGELYRSYDKYAGMVGFYQVDEVLSENDPRFSEGGGDVLCENVVASPVVE